MGCNAMMLCNEINDVILISSALRSAMVRATHHCLADTVELPNEQMMQLL